MPCKIVQLKKGGWAISASSFSLGEEELEIVIICSDTLNQQCQCNATYITGLNEVSLEFLCL